MANNKYGEKESGDTNLIDCVKIKNLEAEPRQYHLRNGLVEPCGPFGETRPILKKNITGVLKELEKRGKIVIMSTGGA